MNPPAQSHLDGTAGTLRHMTRENKLALVVGFGLILFVGILISDHFSTVRSQRAANLTRSIDPLALKNTDNPMLIDLQQPEAKPAVSTTTLNKPAPGIVASGPGPAPAPRKG